MLVLRYILVGMIWLGSSTLVASNFDREVLANRLKELIGTEELESKKEETAQLWYDLACWKAGISAEEYRIPGKNWLETLQAQLETHELCIDLFEADSVLYVFIGSTATARLYKIPLHPELQTLWEHTCVGDSGATERWYELVLKPILPVPVIVRNPLAAAMDPAQEPFLYLSQDPRHPDLVFSSDMEGEWQSVSSFIDLTEDPDATGEILVYAILGLMLCLGGAFILWQRLLARW